MNKQGKPFAFRGKYLFLTVLIFYGVLFLVNSETTLSALQKSSTVLLKILLIIAVVILFTGLLNYFLQPKQVASHLGWAFTLVLSFYILVGALIQGWMLELLEQND